MEKEQIEKNKLYVGNLDYDLQKEELRELFDPYGKILDLFIVNRKGFGFITYESEEEAEAAKSALDEFMFQERPLKVKNAKPKIQR